MTEAAMVATGIAGFVVVFAVSNYAPLWVLRCVAALLMGGLLGMILIFVGQPRGGTAKMSVSDGPPAEFAPFASMLPEDYRILGFMNIGAQNVRTGEHEVDCWVAMVTRRDEPKLLVGSGASKLEAMAEIADRLRRSADAPKETMQ